MDMQIKLGSYMRAWICEKTFNMQAQGASNKSAQSAFAKFPNKQWLRRIRVIVYLLCLVPLLRLLGLGLQDELSANPIEFIEKSTGYWSLLMLLITLSLSPIHLLSGLAWPLQFRRLLGLFMFFYACLHVITYLWLDYHFNWFDISQDIIKHPYVLIGLSAFILTLPLAITSNQAMMRLLRQRWKQLHKSIYLIAIFGVVHFIWLVKKDLREPILFALILSVLLGIRIYYKYKRRDIKTSKPLK